MSQPIVLYRYPLSGHCHRVELLLSLLGVPFELRHVDLGAGEHKTEAFRVHSPLGQVPVLRDGTVTVFDSNAILVYLARRYDTERRWLPAEPEREAEVLSWLGVAAGPLAAGPAAARLASVFGATIDRPRAEATATSLLQVLEATLAERAFLVGERPTLADVALYAYVAHAPEGGISLSPYPQVRAWVARVESLPRFVPMQRAPGAAA